MSTQKLFTVFAWGWQRLKWNCTFTKNCREIIIAGLALPLLKIKDYIKGRIGKNIGRYVGQVSIDISTDHASVEYRLVIRIGRFFRRAICMTFDTEACNLVDTRQIPYQYFKDSLLMHY